jgi:hypothetical protein
MGQMNESLQDDPDRIDFGRDAPYIEATFVSIGPSDRRELKQ